MLCKNNPQISLKEAIDSMEKMLDADDYAINSMKEITDTDYTPDIVRPDCKIIDIDDIITHSCKDTGESNYESDNLHSTASVV
jgi:hypothetical protein